jgi:hypothetical protein
VVPFTQRMEPPVTDPALRFSLDPPAYLTHYQRVGGAAGVAH